MRVETISDKSIWEDAIQLFPEANFLHSWNWGVFHQQLGKTITRLGLYDGTDVKGLVQLVREDARRGRYLTAAGGPLINWAHTQAIEYLFQSMKQIGKKESALFIRFRPQVVDGPALRNTVKQLGCIESPMHVTADLTLQLDITQTEEELLMQMRKNHRSTIRKAHKQGVTTRITQDPTEIKAFYQHQLDLAQKHGFVPFSYDYLYQQFQTFVADDQVALIHSYHGQELLASAFIIFYNQEAVYHYGISTEKNSEYPGSYAVLWEAIREAKGRGCRRFNFWGVAPQGSKHHRYSGVSLFKHGFGGEEVPYLPAHDIPLSWKYWITYMFEKIRSKQRHLD